MRSDDKPDQRIVEVEIDDGTTAALTKIHSDEYDQSLSHFDARFIHTNNNLQVGLKTNFITKCSSSSPSSR